MADELQVMLDDAPDQVEALDISIDQVQDQIDDIQRQIDAITDELLAVAESEFIDYMNNVKIPELKALYAASTAVLQTFGNFGGIGSSGNISQWRVYDSTAGTIYEYNGVNWDDDTSISNYVIDYAFGIDYLHRDVTSGATYGLYDARSNLTTARNILQNNRTKINNSIDIFERYVPGP